MYNKNQFVKTDDKKVLHKVHKNWIVVSLALLGMIGVAKSASVPVHANGITLKDHINNSLQNRGRMTTSQNIVHHPQRTQGRTNNGINIDSAAVQMHQRIVNNANRNSLSRDNNGIYLNRNTDTHLINKANKIVPNNSTNNGEAILSNNRNNEGITVGKVNNNSLHLLTGPKIYTPLGNNDQEQDLKHFYSRIGDYPNQFNKRFNLNNDTSGVRNSGVMEDPSGTSVHYTFYKDGLLHFSDGNLPKRQVSIQGNNQSNSPAGLLITPGQNLNIPFIVKNDNWETDTSGGIQTGLIRAITFNNVKAPQDSSNLFSQMPGLEVVDLKGLDTSNTSNMASMFYYDPLLNKIDSDAMNTSHVTDMNSMFAQDGELKTIDLSHWNTHNVKNMTLMFASTGLRSIDLSNLDMSSILSYYVPVPPTAEPNGTVLEEYASSGVEGLFEEDKSLQSVNLNGLESARLLLASMSRSTVNHHYFNYTDPMYEVFYGDNNIEKITLPDNLSLKGAWSPVLQTPASDSDVRVQPATYHPYAPNIKDFCPAWNWIDGNGSQEIDFNSANNIPSGTYYRADDSSLDGLPITFTYGNSVLNSSPVYGLHELSDLSDLSDENSSDSDNGKEILYITGLPNGYKADPRHTLQVGFDTSNHTYQVPVDKAGTWGTAQWVLTPSSDNDTPGNLYVYNGTINGNLPDSINKSDIQSISFGNNTKLSSNAAGTFKDLPNLQSFGAGLDTSNTTNMDSLFAGDRSLSSIDFGSNFDMSNVTNTSDMFSNDNNLYKLTMSPKVILNKSGNQSWNNSAFFNGNTSDIAGIKSGRSLNKAVYAASDPYNINIHYIINGDTQHPIIGAHKINNGNIADQVKQQSDLPTGHYTLSSNNSYNVQADSNGNKYVNVNLTQRAITLKLYDWLTGKPVSTVIDPNVQDNQQVSDSDIAKLLPSNYHLANHGDNADPNIESSIDKPAMSNSRNYMPNVTYNDKNQTAYIPVVSNNTKNYGFWDTARYTLDNNGLLTVNGRPHLVAKYGTPGETHRVKLYIHTVNGTPTYSDVPSDRWGSVGQGYTQVPVIKDIATGRYEVNVPVFNLIENGQEKQIGGLRSFPTESYKPVSWEDAPSKGGTDVTYVPQNGKVDRFSEFKNLDKVKQNQGIGHSEDIYSDTLMQHENDIKGIRFENNVIAPSDCSAFNSYPVEFKDNSFQQEPASFDGPNNMGEWLPNQKSLNYVDVSGLNTANVKDQSKITSFFAKKADGKVENIVIPGSDNQMGTSAFILQGSPNEPITTHMSGMFAHMPNLTVLDLGGLFSTKGNANADNMFYSDNNLSKLVLGPNTDLALPGQNWQSSFFSNNVNSDGTNSTEAIKGGSAPAGDYYRATPDTSAAFPIDIVNDLGKVVKTGQTLRFDQKNNADKVKSILSSAGYKFLNSDDEATALNNDPAGSIMNGVDTGGVISSGYDPAKNNGQSPIYVPAVSTNLAKVKVPVAIYKNGTSSSVVPQAQSVNALASGQTGEVLLPSDTIKQIRSKGYSFNNNNQYAFFVNPSDINGSTYRGAPLVLYANRVANTVDVHYWNENTNQWVSSPMPSGIKSPVGSDVNLSANKLPNVSGYSIDSSQNLSNIPFTGAPIKVSVKPAIKKYTVNVTFKNQNGKTISNTVPLQLANGTYKPSDISGDALSNANVNSNYSYDSSNSGNKSYTVNNSGGSVTIYLKGKQETAQVVFHDDHGEDTKNGQDVSSQNINYNYGDSDVTLPNPPDGYTTDGNVPALYPVSNISGGKVTVNVHQNPTSYYLNVIFKTKDSSGHYTKVVGTTYNYRDQSTNAHNVSDGTLFNDAKGADSALNDYQLSSSNASASNSVNDTNSANIPTATIDIDYKYANGKVTFSDDGMTVTSDTLSNAIPNSDETNQNLYDMFKSADSKLNDYTVSDPASKNPLTASPSDKPNVSLKYKYAFGTVKFMNGGSDVYNAALTKGSKVAPNTNATDQDLFNMFQSNLNGYEPAQPNNSNPLKADKNDIIVNVQKVPQHVTGTVQFIDKSNNNVITSDNLPARTNLGTVTDQDLYNMFKNTDSKLDNVALVNSNKSNQLNAGNNGTIKVYVNKTSVAPKYVTGYVEFDKSDGTKATETIPANTASDPNETNQDLYNMFKSDLKLNNWTPTDPNVKNPLSSNLNGGTIIVKLSKVPAPNPPQYVTGHVVFNDGTGHKIASDALPVKTSPNANETNQNLFDMFKSADSRLNNWTPVAPNTKNPLNSSLNGGNITVEIKKASSPNRPAQYAAGTVIFSDSQGYTVKESLPNGIAPGTVKTDQDLFNMFQNSLNGYTTVNPNNRNTLQAGNSNEITVKVRKIAQPNQPSSDRYVEVTFKDISDGKSDHELVTGKASDTENPSTLVSNDSNLGGYVSANGDEPFQLGGLSSNRADPSVKTIYITRANPNPWPRNTTGAVKVNIFYSDGSTAGSYSVIGSTSDSMNDGQIATWLEGNNHVPSGYSVNNSRFDGKRYTFGTGGNAPTATIYLKKNNGPRENTTGYIHVNVVALNGTVSDIITGDTGKSMNDSQIASWLNSNGRIPSGYSVDASRFTSQQHAFGAEGNVPTVQIYLKSDQPQDTAGYIKVETLYPDGAPAGSFIIPGNTQNFMNDGQIATWLEGNDHVPNNFTVDTSKLDGQEYGFGTPGRVPTAKIYLKSSSPNPPTSNSDSMTVTFIDNNSNQVGADTINGIAGSVISDASLTAEAQRDGSLSYSYSDISGEASTANQFVRGGSNVTVKVLNNSQPQPNPRPRATPGYIKLSFVNDNGAPIGSDAVVSASDTSDWPDNRLADWAMDNDKVPAGYYVDYGDLKGTMHPFNDTDSGDNNMPAVVLPVKSINISPNNNPVNPNNTPNQNNNSDGNGYIFPIKPTPNTPNGNHNIPNGSSDRGIIPIPQPSPQPAPNKKNSDNNRGANNANNHNINSNNGGNRQPTVPAFNPFNVDWPYSDGSVTPKQPNTPAKLASDADKRRSDNDSGRSELAQGPFGTEESHAARHEYKRVMHKHRGRHAITHRRNHRRHAIARRRNHHRSRKN